MRARRLTDLDAGLSIGELAKFDFAAVETEALANAVHQQRVGRTGEDAGLTHGFGWRECLQTRVRRE